MIAAVHHNAAGPPWLAILIASESWGMAPWAMAGGSPAIWFLRWRYYRSQLAAAQQIAARNR